MATIGQARIEHEGVSLQLGAGTPYPVTAFKRGFAPTRGSERDLARRDGVAFGPDLKGGPVHEIGIAVLGDGATSAEREASVRDLYASLAVAWSADGLRARGGALARLWIGDRFAYGRPRDLDPDDSGLWDGTIEVVGKFVAADDHWYGPAEITTVRFSTPETGGLVFPAEAPFVFDAGPTRRNGDLVVPGSFPTHPDFTIHGPVLNPVIEVTGIGTLRFDVDLAHDQTLEVSTRPGASGVYLDGAPLPGALSPRGDRLSDLRLPVGAHAVVLSGYDPTGTGFLTVQIEPAYTSF